MRREGLKNLQVGKSIGLLCMAAVLCLGGISGCGSKTERNPDQPLPVDGPAGEVGSVEFQFFFADDQQTTITVDGVQAGDTVLDCMEKIQDPKIVVNGSGQNAFVSSIGDQHTAAGEGWSYRVNDQWADRSVGVYEIQPGDVVTWSYGGFEAGE